MIEQLHDDSVQRINKIMYDIDQEIKFTNELIKGVNCESLSPETLKTCSDNSTGVRFRSSQLKKVIDDLNELQSCLDKDLLQKEIYMWKNLLLYCNIYDTMTFLDHECSMDCCSPIKLLANSQKFSKKNVNSGSQTKRILDIFYNENDREYFQRLMILNYMKGYVATDQNDFRHYSISLSNVHKLYGCFPSGRLHMCHPIAAKRYETCSKTGSVCQNTGKVFCSLSGLFVPGHWSENDIDSSINCYSEDLQDMSYVSSTKSAINSTKNQTSQCFSKTYDLYSDLISKIDQKIKTDVYGMEGKDDSNKHKQKSLEQQKRKIDGKNINLDIKDIGQYLTDRTLELSDDSTLMPSKLFKKPNSHISTNSDEKNMSRHKNFHDSLLFEDDSIQKSLLPDGIKKMFVSNSCKNDLGQTKKKKQMSSGLRFLEKHISKDSREDVKKLKREFSTKTPSKKILDRRYGQTMRIVSKEEDLNTDLDIFRGINHQQTSKQILSSSLPIPTILQSNVQQLGNSGLDDGYGEYQSLNSFTQSNIRGLPTFGKDNLIGSLIGMKRTESRIKLAIDSQTMFRDKTGDCEHYTTPETYESILLPKPKFSDHFWTNITPNFKKKVLNIINGIKKTCILLFWKLCYTDGLIGMGNITINPNKFILHDCENEMNVFLNEVARLIPKIQNMYESSDINNQTLNNRQSNTFEYNQENKTHEVRQNKKSLNQASLVLGVCTLVFNGYKIGNMVILEPIPCKYFPGNVNDLSISRNTIDEEITKKMEMLDEIMLGKTQQQTTSYTTDQQNQQQKHLDTKGLKLVIETFKKKLVIGKEWILRFFSDGNDSLFSGVVPVKHYRGDYKKRQQKGYDIIKRLFSEYEDDIQILRSILSDNRQTLS